MYGIAYRRAHGKVYRLHPEVFKTRKEAEAYLDEGIVDLYRGCTFKVLFLDL